MKISLKDQFDRSSIETIFDGFYNDPDCKIGQLARRFYIDQFEVCFDQEGNIHSEDGPAIIGRSSMNPDAFLNAWYQNGVFHRLRQPAIDASNVTHSRGVSVQEWYQNGVRHRERGPAAIQSYCGISGPFREKEEWYSNGLLHRIGGPAVKTFDSFTREDYAAHYRAGEKVSEQTTFRQMTCHPQVRL
ncbi:hypothetical protein ACFQ1E_15125 [Sphingomonas canadensis]|uniref:SnoaL-like domain-containing protein n=1 Tax=Sphingomonas canadensis TaxID=1219257 RepID=A0ABW3HEB7_9SPHN|nr:hypothetical protein [Sphingomonas canadensis]MCW3837467.1 hypothetical protein [Sphingomonas canadensis]